MGLVKGICYGNDAFRIRTMSPTQIPISALSAATVLLTTLRRYMAGNT
jgi:hypothetical protein